MMLGKQACWLLGHMMYDILVCPQILDLFDSESEDASDFEELIEVQANG